MNFTTDQWNHGYKKYKNTKEMCSIANENLLLLKKLLEP